VDTQSAAQDHGIPLNEHIGEYHTSHIYTARTLAAYSPFSQKPQIHFIRATLAKKADSYRVHKKPHFLTGNAYQLLCTRMYTEALYPKPHGADDLWWVFQFLTIEDLCVPIFQATCLLLSHFEDKHDTYFAGLKYDHCKTSTTWKHQE
jgi:hypothetical protein